MVNSYYNTNNEQGLKLISSNLKARSQEERILTIFKRKNNLSASEAWDLFGVKNAPITSVRRAITNLCNRGELEKTNNTVTGLYGKQEHVYQVAQISSPKEYAGEVQLSMF